ncbi:MAG TPA: DUF6250 domain-containing protein [Gemmataceae bacterium]|nr:DUF6250 domain-containing protein [Gemmataceae bacterium]
MIWSVALSYPLVLAACERTPPPPVTMVMPLPDQQPEANVLFKDNFRLGVDNWIIENEGPGSVGNLNGVLDIDMAAGCTVWFRHKLKGPLAIEYEATAVQAGGSNDRVSDLNCFWMARDPKNPNDLFARKRSGKFEDYDTLQTYYVGLGGNGNTTTRFRRYIGKQDERPLLPDHDLTDPKFMLAPNVPQQIRLVAAGKRIEFYRDGQRLFQMDDPEPYTEGWFGFRTTKSHLKIRGFRVFRIEQPEG